ncbi:MAG: LPXTG cell wall anchor domain-containing protein, partial [Oscillospiraceae bacterium]|nr:LPXTG cell wall anchor domain-containing protein [Oscillospiraceae bacterium]
PGLRIEKKVSNYGDSELHDNITGYIDEVITYTITVSNTGDGAMDNFQVVDDLGNTTPNGRNLIGVYIDNVHNIRVNGAALVAPSTFVNDVLTVVIPSLAPNAQVVITFDAYVLPAARGQTWTNLAVLQDQDGNQLYYEYEYEYWCEEEEEYVTRTRRRPHRDESTVEVPKPFLRIIKSVNRPYPQFVNVGEHLTYTIEVRNLPRDNEPTATAFDFWMIDDLAHLVDTYIDNVRNVTATVQGGFGEVGTVEIVGGNLVRVHIIELPVNGIVTITFEATVQPGAAGRPPWTNIARLYEDGDGNSELINYVRGDEDNWMREPGEDDGYYINEDDATKIVPDEHVPSPAMSIEKRVNGVDVYTVPQGGSPLRYTIVARNTSDYDATGFRVVDDLSRLINTYLAEFTLANVTITPAAATTAVTLNGGVLTVVLGTVAPGDYVTIEISAQLRAGLVMNSQRFNNTAILQTPEETEAGRSTATVILPPPPPPTPPGSMPQTGIEANAELWLTLLGIAVMVAIGAAIVIKRKDKERSKNT